MTGMAKRRPSVGRVVVLLAFTGSGVAAAQAPQDTPPQPRAIDPTPPPDRAPSQVAHRNWVDDPYEPDVTDGTFLRVGTAVGSFTVDQRKYTVLGAVISLGRRVGRFSFDFELDRLQLQDSRPTSIILGNATNLAMVGRFDVLRLGPRVVGANSMVAFYAEGAVQRTMYHYDRPQDGEAPRAVPDDSGRTQAAVGFGAILDHRLEQPLGFPNRFGWQLGWRLATQPRDSHDPMVACRGCLAAQQQTPMTSRDYDTEVILTSTLDFTW
jgi:hypothetical protein